MLLQALEGGIIQNEDGSWDPFSLDDLLHSGAADHLEAIGAVSGNASKEAALQAALDKMQADWASLAFRVLDYKDTGTYIIGGTDEIQVPTSLS